MKHIGTLMKELIKRIENERTGKNQDVGIPKNRNK